MATIQMMRLIQETRLRLLRGVDRESAISDAIQYLESQKQAKPKRSAKTGRDRMEKGGEDRSEAASE